MWSKWNKVFLLRRVVYFIFVESVTTVRRHDQHTHRRDHVHVERKNRKMKMGTKKRSEREREGKRKNNFLHARAKSFKGMKNWASEDERERVNFRYLQLSTIDVSPSWFKLMIFHSFPLYIWQLGQLHNCRQNLADFLWENAEKEDFNLSSWTDSDNCWSEKMVLVDVKMLLWAGEGWIMQKIIRKLCAKNDGGRHVSPPYLAC